MNPISNSNDVAATEFHASNPKFYVQCGPVQMILSAESPRCAAVSALGRSLEPHLWIYDDAGLSDQNRRDHLMIEALLHLEPVVSISERGFDSADAVRFGTPEIVAQWHDLMTGMNRLFAAAGLLPRPLAASSREVPKRPR